MKHIVEARQAVRETPGWNKWDHIFVGWQTMRVRERFITLVANRHRHCRRRRRRHLIINIIKGYNCYCHHHFSKCRQVENFCSSWIFSMLNIDTCIFSLSSSNNSLRCYLLYICSIVLPRFSSSATVLLFNVCNLRITRPWEAIRWVNIPVCIMCCLCVRLQKICDKAWENNILLLCMLAYYNYAWRKL